MIVHLSRIGARVEACISIFDREEGAISHFISKGWDSIPLITLSELYPLLATPAKYLPHLTSDDIDDLRSAFRPKISILDMANEEIEEIIISIVQISSNISVEENYRFTATHAEHQSDLIKSQIQKAIKFHNSRVLIFPELSMPYKILSDIQKVARQNNIWIIGGMEYDHSGRNICHIISSNGLIMEQPKLTRSPYDGSQMIPGHQQWIFRKTGIGDFAVVICIDILQSEMISELKNQIDILFIISYNAATNLFIGKAQVLAIELHCFVVLANVANFGKSVVFSPTKGKRKTLLKTLSAAEVIGTARLDIPGLRESDPTLYYKRLIGTQKMWPKNPVL
jgi:predicted amidohydrolase